MDLDADAAQSLSLQQLLPLRHYITQDGDINHNYTLSLQMWFYLPEVATSMTRPLCPVSVSAAKSPSCRTAPLPLEWTATNRRRHRPPPAQKSHHASREENSGAVRVCTHTATTTKKTSIHTAERAFMYDPITHLSLQQQPHRHHHGLT